MYSFHHHGAVNGVTGSCHELRIGERSVLIDCGLFQGAEIDDRPSTAPDNPLLIEFPLEPIQALLVTHCHIDHVGRIPYLLAAGFQGPIFATEATAHLLPMVIEDAIKVGITRDQSIIQPFLKTLKQRLQPIPYKEWFAVPGFEEQGGLRAKFHPAGHIIGSAYIELDRCFSS